MAMPDSSTTKPVSGASVPLFSDLLRQLSSGPSIREVASTALRPALKALYPQLDINPALVFVVTPTWQIVEGEVIPGISRVESLTGTLVRHGLRKTTVTYIDGEHFLSRQPHDASPIPLPVKIDAIGRLINELAPLLFVAYQEQQLDFWNQTGSAAMPRWQELSRALRNIWNVRNVKGWDDDQCAMARNLFNYPDLAVRLPHDKYLSRTYLIDLDIQDGETSKHLRLLDIAVLIGVVGQRTLILTYSIANDFQSFDSLEQLGESLLAYLETPVSALQWRLFEPSGNFFDIQACTMIALQSDTIGEINASTPLPGSNLGHHVSSVANDFDGLSAKEYLRFSRIHDLLPAWLAKASSADLSSYSRYLMDLAQLQAENAGKSFQDGIPSIQDFALQAIRRQMLIEHPDAAKLKLEDIEIVVTSPVVWGTFVLPGKTDITRIPLTELALENLIAIPPGNKVVHCKNADAVPVWMTPAYLEGLVSQVNIGQTYPALIKRTLIDASPDSQRRKNLYARHLRLQLPLLALQNKIRGEAGIDERGYRYVAAVMASSSENRRVDGHEIVMRPLAFFPSLEPDATPDEVDNMFVIGPRGQGTGPVLLYRPLLTPALIQYPSTENLLYAIKHSKELRLSVLAWLPDNARTNYARYVFPGELPSVWSLSQLLVDPLTPLTMTGPISFGERVIEDELMPTLFNANASALITLADRQSVSNAESRWATLKQSAWMIFNAALPFLGRTVGTAAWIWQIMDDLQQAADARENADGQHEWAALTDVFLTLAMVLVSHATAPRESAQKTTTPHGSRPRETALAEKVSVTRKPDVATDTLPALHETSLHSDTALIRSRLSLGHLLDSFKIPKPEGLGQPAIEQGPHQHLSALGQKWYANIGERWFEVTVNDNDDVLIIDSRQPTSRTGPLLVNNQTGQWFVDTRLRLRGGGLKSRREQIQRENKARITELRTQLAAFDLEMDSKRAELTSAHAALNNAPGTSAEARRQLFLDKLDTRLKDYDVALDRLKTLNRLDTVPNYRTAMVELLGTQLFFNQTGIDQQHTTYTQTLRRTFELLEQAETEGKELDRGTLQKMTDLTEELINKIEFAQSRFQELSTLGKNAAELTHEYKQKLPTFDVQDLKAFQVTLAKELCLKEGNTPLMAEARIAMDSIGEHADLTIQASLDVTLEDNELNLGERIETLNTLVSQFTAIDQRLEDFATDYPEQLAQQQFDRLRKRTNEFHQATVNYLVQLLREREALEPKPGPSRVAAPPRKKIIKTRYKGIVVGEVRKDTPVDEVLVDVTEPMTGKVIATFHEKSPGVWLERATRKPSPATGLVLDLGAQVEVGQALLNDLETFIHRTRAHAKRPNRIPVEIEDMFQQQAGKLKRAADGIEEALSTGNTPDTQSDSAKTLKKQLTEAVARLYSEGHMTRVEMIKLQPPTAARIEWLRSKNVVDIVRNGERKRLKGPGKDYLQEYEILDRKTRKPLWYAHLHYAGPTGPVDSFTAAHLKTRDQRLLKGRFDWRATTSNHELIAVYRSEISPQQAKELFFTQTPPSATGS
jgi:hypothetical protein